MREKRSAEKLGLEYSGDVAAAGNRAARDVAIGEVQKVATKRGRDKSYRAAVRAALAEGLDPEQAKAAGRKASAKFSNILQFQQKEGAEVCTFSKLVRDEKTGNYTRTEVADPPAKVRAMAPREGNVFWRYYLVCNQAEATHWEAWTVGPQGGVKDNTIRILTKDDVVKNAHGRVEKPRYPLKKDGTPDTRDKIRGAKVLYIIAIPLKYVGKP